MGLPRTPKDAASALNDRYLSARLDALEKRVGLTNVAVQQKAVFDHVFPKTVAAAAVASAVRMERVSVAFAVSGNTNQYATFPGFDDNQISVAECHIFANILARPWDEDTAFTPNLDIEYTLVTYDWAMRGDTIKCNLDGESQASSLSLSIAFDVMAIFPCPAPRLQENIDFSRLPWGDATYGQWRFNRGSGLTLYDYGREGRNMEIGRISHLVTGVEPSWVDEGLDFAFASSVIDYCDSQIAILDRFGDTILAGDANFPWSAAFTVYCVWQCDATSGARWGIANQRGANETVKINWAIGWRDGKPTAGFGDDSTFSEVTSTGAFAADTWHLTVFRYDGAKMELWVDGTKTITQAETDTPYGNNKEMEVLINRQIVGASAANSYTGKVAFLYASKEADTEDTIATNCTYIRAGIAARVLRTGTAITIL